MNRLLLCYALAQAALAPLAVAYGVLVPGKAGLRFAWALHRVLLIGTVVLPLLLAIPLPRPQVDAAQPAIRAVQQLVLPVVSAPGAESAAARRAPAAARPYAGLLLAAAAGAGVLVFAMRYARQKQFEARARRAGRVRRIGRLRVVESATVRVPFSTGLLSPSIYLPVGSPGTREGHRMLLAHEGAHLRHLHAAWTLAEAFLVHALWLNPLLHLLSRRGQEIREMLCDAEVCRRFDPSVYGRLVLYTAVRAHRAGVPALADAWLGRGVLKERISRILEGGPMKVSRIGRLGAGASAAFAAALVLLGAAFLAPAGAQSEIIRTTAGEAFGYRSSHVLRLPVTDFGRVEITYPFSSDRIVAEAAGGMVAGTVTTAITVAGSITISGTNLSTPLRHEAPMSILVVPAEAPVIATTGSSVVAVTQAADGTWSVELSTTDGYSFVYGLLGKVSVRVGELVDQASVIGTPSMRPDGRGALSYAVWLNGAPVDPLGF